ncbi:kinase-like domain-containing protein [Rhizophagus irregularis DAOM 181602=DAOM 197198]|uniref:HTH myb-type domain-containing protein n=1 Tax=Rhizophagus irregularis (strain DAOM 181602 / DAOM 197198 / MUCL 43194) TaxID=747089 RepID=U9TCU5_RHIID|nr:kinase-like domain-containing protein [Rhizophagus irregularis DAOM 181602=DAOM 197198]
MASVSIFSKEDDNLIIQYMKEFGHHRNPFTLTSSLMPKYTRKQIRQRWNEYLNPKSQKHRMSKVINWKHVICDLERQFDKHYSQNQIKNYWYANQRYILSYRNMHLSKPLFDDEQYQNYSPLLPTMEPTSHEPKFNKPYKMQPL